MALEPGLILLMVCLFVRYILIYLVSATIETNGKERSKYEKIEQYYICLNMASNMSANSKPLIGS